MTLRQSLSTATLAAALGAIPTPKGAMCHHPANTVLSQCWDSSVIAFPKLAAAEAVRTVGRLPVVQSLYAADLFACLLDL